MAASYRECRIDLFLFREISANACSLGRVVLNGVITYYAHTGENARKEKYRMVVT